MRVPSVHPRFMFTGLAGLMLALAACAPAAAPSPTAAPAKPAATTAPAAPAQPAAAPAAKPAEKPAEKAAAQPAAKPASKDLFRLEFAMPWILPTEYFYFLTADEKGFYREEGIQINLNEGSGSGNAVKIVGAGSTPIGLADANRILAGRVQGVPIKSIMAFFYTSPVLVISPKDKPIKTLKELEGKKIGDAPDSANLLIWRAAMLRAGADMNKVQLIGVDPKAKNQLLLAGQLDAVLAQSDVAQLEAEGHPMHKLLITEDAGFEVVSDSIFANEEFAKKNPEIVKGFLRATIKGAHYAKANPKEAIDFGAKKAPTFTRQQLELMYELEDSWIWTKFTPKDKFGLQSVQSWNNLQDILLENKQIDRKIDMNELVDNSYLPYQ